MSPLRKFQGNEVRRMIDGRDVNDIHLYSMSPTLPNPAGVTGLKFLTASEIKAQAAGLKSPADQNKANLINIVLFQD